MASHAARSKAKMCEYTHISLVPRLPPLAPNYCVTFKLALAECEFKGHAIIAPRKGGEPGNEATRT